MAAVMAEQAAVCFMIGHRHRAIRAVDRFITFGALQQRVIPAAVQQQNALLPALQIVAERRCQRFRKRSAVSVHALLVHINDRDLRQRRLIIALRHRQQAVDPAFRQIAAFQRGRRGCKHQHGVVILCACSCDLCRMITRRLLRFIRMLALLIQNDEANIRQRCKHGAPCADHNGDFPAADQLVGIKALPQR